MNPAQLLAHFDRISDAPDAIPRLRQLILNLAVRGKLVEQDHRDEPAECLLTPEQQVDAKRAVQPLSDDLPKSWAKVFLGQLIALKKGKKPAVLNEEGRGLPYLDIAALERGELRQFTEDEKCPRATSKDLIVVCDGSRSGLLLDGREGIIGSTLAVIQFSGFMREYLRVLLNALYEDLNAAKKGAAIPHLNIPRLLSLYVDLPPLAEQYRIVVKVEELMALCDRLEAAQVERESQRDRLAIVSLYGLNNGADADASHNHARFYFNHLPRLTTRSEHIQQLRQTILNLAVRGKLVPQDPDEELLANLLTELARLKAKLLAERKIRNQKVSDSPSPNDFPFDIPDEWKWVRLGQVVTLLGGYAYESGTYVPESSNQIIRLGNVKNDTLLLAQKPAFIPDTLAQQTSDYAILEGDILITMTGTKAKRDYAFTLAVKPTDLEKRHLFLNQRVGAIRPFQPELVPLINVFLKSDQLLDLIFATATGTANQANIGTSSILDLTFPLPPLAEQHRIVAKVDELMSLCDRLEAQLTITQTESRRLLETILHEALKPVPV